MFFLRVSSIFGFVRCWCFYAVQSGQLSVIWPPSSCAVVIQMQITGGRSLKMKAVRQRAKEPFLAEEPDEPEDKKKEKESTYPAVDRIRKRPPCLFRFVVTDRVLMTDDARWLGRSVDWRFLGPGVKNFWGERTTRRAAKRLANCRMLGKCWGWKGGK